MLTKAKKQRVIKAAGMHEKAEKTAYRVPETDLCRHDYFQFGRPAALDCRDGSEPGRSRHGLSVPVGIHSRRRCDESAGAERCRSHRDSRRQYVQTAEDSRVVMNSCSHSLPRAPARGWLCAFVGRGYATKLATIAKPHSQEWCATKASSAV